MRESTLILIVDDDPVFCRVMAQVLSMWKLQVEAYVEPAAFIARAKTAPPRLCLIDLNIGNPLSGFDLLASTKALYPTVPVFMVSGSSDAKLVSRALEAGASDYLLKPVDREVFVAKLSDYLKTQELEIAKPSPTTGRTVEIKTKLSLPGKVVGVDELGFTLVGPHMIAKGAKIAISGELVGSISGSSKPLEVTALSSALEDDTGLFRTYLEFSPGELQEKARAWIKARKSAHS